MKVNYPILFVTSLMTAAFFALKLPTPEQTWPTTWPFFILAVAISTMSLVLWYKKNAALRLMNDKNGPQINQQETLKTITDDLKKMYESFDDHEPEALCQRIESIAQNHLTSFIDQREKLTRSFGIEKGADIIIKSAQGERLLNRVWTALKDDHKPEAKSSLMGSLSAFENALLALDPATKKT